LYIYSTVKIPYIAQIDICILTSDPNLNQLSRVSCVPYTSTLKMKAFVALVRVVHTYD